MKQQYFEIGQIVNHFGIRGMVKVNPFTDDISQFEEMETVLVDKKGSLQEMQIEEVKYRNCYIKLPREKARKLPENTYFIADLIGLEVYTEEGRLLGKVDDIYNSGASDIYVIKDATGKQILLPAIKEVIKQIDLEQEKIVVHLLEGLV